MQYHFKFVHLDTIVTALQYSLDIDTLYDMGDMT